MNKFEKILKELVFNTGAEGVILISPDGAFYSIYI